VPIWIRHVVVPGLTDGEEHIAKLGEVIKKINNVDKIELLPFHQLGENKYDGLGLEYPLKGVKPMDKEKVKEYEAVLKMAEEEM
jgi:pyruvate formate lyase activating enzyme